MKVICIDASPSKTSGKLCPLTEGEIYIKIGDSAGGLLGIPHYKLEGFANIEFGAFRFIPLSQIDETTFSRNYKKEGV